MKIWCRSTVNMNREANFEFWIDNPHDYRRNEVWDSEIREIEATDAIKRIFENSKMWDSAEVTIHN